MIGDALQVILHLTPIWAFAMALAAALGWHLGTALWRGILRLVGWRS